MASKEKNVVGKKKEEQSRGEQWRGKENKDVMNKRKKESIGGLDEVHGMVFQSVSQQGGSKKKWLSKRACTHIAFRSLSLYQPSR